MGAIRLRDRRILAPTLEECVRLGGRGLQSSPANDAALALGGDYLGLPDRNVIKRSTYGFAGAGSHVWRRQRGTRLVWFFVAGGGGGGGGGFTRAAGAAGGGGGGGGCAGYARLMVPAYDLPDVLMLQPGAGGTASTGSGVGGGAGGTTNILGLNFYQVLFAVTGGGGGGAGTAGAAGTAGSGGTAPVLTNQVLGYPTIGSYFAGVPGGVGGSTSGGQGANTSFSPFVGGSGGGGASAANATGNGGGVNMNAAFNPNVQGNLVNGGLGGATGGNPGDPGWFQQHPFFICYGGAGGGASGTSGSGGAGGDCVGYVSGGGGGGAGVTGGAGGKGGGGIIIIVEV